jgi:hypothetical protein
MDKTLISYLRNYQGENTDSFTLTFMFKHIAYQSIS